MLIAKRDAEVISSAKVLIIGGGVGQAKDNLNISNLSGSLTVVAQFNAFPWGTFCLELAHRKLVAYRGGVQ